MDRKEQLIKELQMLNKQIVSEEEMDKVIEEKMMGMWRDARRNAETEYVNYKTEFEARQKANFSSEDIDKMSKSHIWQQATEDEYGESKCGICEIDENDFSRFPQYCKPRCKKCNKRVEELTKNRFGEMVYECDCEKLKK